MLADAIAEIETMIDDYNRENSLLSTEQYEALKIALDSMKSMWYAKQALRLTYKEWE